MSQVDLGETQGGRTEVARLGAGQCFGEGCLVRLRALLPRPHARTQPRTFGIGCGRRSCAAHAQTNKYNKATATCVVSADATFFTLTKQAPHRCRNTHRRALSRFRLGPAPPVGCALFIAPHSHRRTTSAPGLTDFAHICAGTD